MTSTTNRRYRTLPGRPGSVRYLLFGVEVLHAIVYGIVIELFVCDVQRFIRDMFQDVSFQFGEFLQHLLRLALLVADVLQIG